MSAAVRTPVRQAVASPDFRVLPLKMIGSKAFGALVEAAEGSPALRPCDLLSDACGQKLRRLWLERGVLVIRGLDDMTAQQLATISGHFGPLEPELATGRQHARVAGLPVMRLGNVTAPDGSPICMASGDVFDPLPADGNPQYRPETRRPIWHTDATFRELPPAGSALFCRRAPEKGGATCFADMRAALASLPAEEQCALEDKDCICSLSHHDFKVRARQPTHPAPTPALRAANPPRRVPLVLEHPCTGERSLYGMNSSTCCIVAKGESITKDRMDQFELSAEEDESMNIWRGLLERVTTPEFTLVWKWRFGDLVIWDNRSTIHSATGFDHEKYLREMWRTTILSDLRACGDYNVKAEEPSIRAKM